MLAGRMPELSSDQVDTYWRRIGLDGPLPPTLDSLAAIQWAHLHSVPFENLDISFLDQPFSLDIDAIHDKVVDRNRGGFCFELNGLLASVLESAGYGVERMAAHFSDAEEWDPFDHLVLIVTVPADGSRWYVDVGAGRVNSLRPVPIGGVSVDGSHRSRLVDGQWLVETVGDDGAWGPVLTWGPEIHDLAAFEPRCAHFQTHPDSFFRSGALCTILTPGGRITLARRTLISTVDGQRTEREIESNAEISDLLRTVFGIDHTVDDRWR